MMATNLNSAANARKASGQTRLNQLDLMPAALLLIGLLITTNTTIGEETSKLSGREIMDEIYRRHEQFPYVFEEQTMILIDSAGNRDTRKLRRYSRMESEEFARYLLVFDDPPEIRGVGLLTTRLATGETETGIYLPSYGPRLIYSIGEDESGNFLGTDFTVRDFIPDILDEFNFVRQEDVQIDKVDYYVIDVTEQNQRAFGPSLRRHYIRQDNFYITRTDTFDRQGRLHKRFTRHDLKPLGNKMWRANMLLMDDYKAQHQSLIKITRRVFSRDYVPEDMFSLGWLVENRGMRKKAADKTPQSINETDKPTIEKREVTSNSGEIQ
ncbi:MAG: outer membrane lipoprotein-sorting protein [Gammaproteobacteria bacterium]|nr:MAG: outer membrane lipoprotein-sorting protein [Gammaproteobacteria bacterium]